MRVLHLTRDFPPRSAGGISTAVGGMTSALHAAGVACAVVSFDDWRPRARVSGDGAVPEPEPGPVGVLRVSIPEHLEYARVFARAFAPTVVHVHHAVLWPVAQSLREALGIPAVLHVHVLQAHQNSLRGLERGTLSSRAQGEALCAADHVIAPSRAAAELVRASSPAASSRVSVVGFGVNVIVNEAPPPVRRREALYVGRFADVNGTAELIDIVPRVLSRVPDAQFCIAGGIPHNAKAERRWHRRFEAAWDASTRARVQLVGWLSPASLRQRYARAGVVVSPSWFESFGLVILEAMACGAPIAATGVGAVPELVQHGRTGLLCEPRDPVALADNAVRLLTEPALAASLASAARSSAAHEHSWRAAVESLMASYRRVAA